MESGVVWCLLGQRKMASTGRWVEGDLRLRQTGDTDYYYLFQIHTSPQVRVNDTESREHCDGQQWSRLSSRGGADGYSQGLKCKTMYFWYRASFSNQIKLTAPIMATDKTSMLQLSIFKMTYSVWKHCQSSKRIQMKGIIFCL